jgi:hypothetical protein
MFRLSKWIILVLLVVLGTSIILMPGCEGGKVTITIPPVTLTAPPVTVTATLAPTTTPGETTTTPITPSGLVPASVTLSSTDANTKIRTLHTLVARVVSKDGTPVPGVTVQWMLDRASDSVGYIVSLGNVEPQKIENTWGIVKTDSNGQAWIIITAVREGDTYIMVYVPDISFDNRSVFAIQHWIANTD